MIKLNHKRQRYAYKNVEVLLSTGSEMNGRLQGLPLQLRQQGLSSTVALLLKESKFRPFADCLGQWLLKEWPNHPKGNGSTQDLADGKALLDYCMTFDARDLGDYYAMEAEAMTLLGELKLLANAFKS